MLPPSSNVAVSIEGLSILRTWDHKCRHHRVRSAREQEVGAMEKQLVVTGVGLLRLPPNPVTFFAAGVLLGAAVALATFRLAGGHD
jgi:hypothetical protein